MIFTKNALTVLVLSYSSRDALVYGAGFYMWKLGHLDGPHDESRGLGISRDGKFGVGTTDVVDKWKAWRMDIDWIIRHDEEYDTDTPGYPPLPNELFVQQEVGLGAAYCSSDLDLGLFQDTDTYNLDDKEGRIPNCPWGGSKVAGQIMEGPNPRFGLLFPDSFDPEECDLIDSFLTSDFGGGVNNITAKDISSDGSIIVGYGNAKKGEVGFIANEDYKITDSDGKTQFIKFRDLAKPFKLSQYEACSWDGTYIVGYGKKTPNENADNVPFISKVIDDPNIWDTDTETVVLETTELPRLPTGKPGPGQARAITTSNGKVVVGGSINGQAVIWFQEENEDPLGEPVWVAKDIGKCQKGHPVTNSVVTGIIATPGGAAGDYMAIGTATTSKEPGEAFIWKGNADSVEVVCPEDDEIDQFEMLFLAEYVLTHTGVGEASSAGSDWVYTNATGIAIGEDHDGYPNNIRILGFGQNPEGGTEAFLFDGVPYGAYVFVPEEE